MCHDHNHVTSLLPFSSSHAFLRTWQSKVSHVIRVMYRWNLTSCFALIILYFFFSILSNTLSIIMHLSGHSFKAKISIYLHFSFSLLELIFDSDKYNHDIIEDLQASFLFFLNYGDGINLNLALMKMCFKIVSFKNSFRGIIIPSKKS